MTDEELSGELERRGANLASWPPDLRREAETLLAASATAREILRKATALDRLLAEPTDAAAPSAESLVAAAVAHAQEPAETPRLVVRAPHRPAMWLRYAACVAAGVVGLLIGALQAQAPSVPDDTFDLALGPPGGLDVD